MKDSIYKNNIWSCHQKHKIKNKGLINNKKRWPLNTGSKTWSGANR